MSKVDFTENPTSIEPRFILITQCLQNDLFRNEQCRLYLGGDAVSAMLVGAERAKSSFGVELSEKSLADGPLGQFLNSTIGTRRQGGGAGGRGKLHVINIRDWHTPGPAYDQERRLYGTHCEKGTWGAGYIDGLQCFLDPRGSSLHEEARFLSEGDVSIYHIHSDSVFDFRPRVDSGVLNEGRLSRTELEAVLDLLIQGADNDIAHATQTLPRMSQSAVMDELNKLAEKTRRNRSEPGAPVYLAVIGAFADIKVLTLIGGLNARYNLPNLGLSDTLSASSSLERHIFGLDFCDKVMGVEIIHGVNDLIRYLGGTPQLDDESRLIGSDNFAQYKSYFKDKQSVLAYQSEKLQDYLRLTEKRALDTYRTISRSNRFLIGFGSAFLIVSLLLTVAAAIGIGAVDWKLPIITGGIGLLQFVGAFYSGPTRDLNRNLTNLATYRMVLESHSLKMAFARFHLTTPFTLREVRTEVEAQEAGRQIDVLERALAVIEKLGEADYRALKELGFNDGDKPDVDDNTTLRARSAVEDARADSARSDP